MPSPILARADALMQRRRSTTPESDDIPILTDSINVEDDFPVLLDIETPVEVIENISETEAASTTEESQPPSLLDAGMRDIIAHELARRVEQRLIAELPRLIESTVHDFLAEHEMISSLQTRD